MGKSNKHLTLRTSEDLHTETGTWVECRFLTLSCYENCHKASDMSVLGELAQLDTRPVEGPGFSFVFSSWPALIRTRTDWCAVHTSRWSFQGFFGFASSISSQKGSSSGHERWTKSGSLTLGKKSPACAALQCSQADLLLSGASTKLTWGICFGPGASGLRAIGPTGTLVIWKWHLDIQVGKYSQALEKLDLCAHSEKILRCKKHSSPCLGKEKPPQGGTTGFMTEFL